MDSLIKGMAVFARVVEQGSMAAAATELGISSSAVSQQIARLEREAGVSLLHRSTRRLNLTEAGRVFYDSCVQVCELAEQARHRLGEFHQSPVGELRMSAPIGFAGELMSAALKPVIENHPNLRLRLVFQDEPIDLVAQRLDLAICVGPLPDSSLVARHLVDWPVVICAAPEYLAGHACISEPEHLQGVQWLSIYTDTQSNQMQLTHSQGKQVGLVLDSRIEVNNIQALIQFTLDGMGCAVLPEPEVRAALASGRLVRVLPGWSPPLVSLYAVTVRRDVQPAKVQIVIEAMRRFLRKRERRAMSSSRGRNG